ncbi:hypothetical protein [Plantactinospora sp. KBS50]|uniref:hypothetical protein n=1 Tax=Plantactinospora sp. KBS50 TaxID=2024580 RepID=UPI000BAAE682|nr:hypothetical protein [Plantactinospora sp. KBS50]ASW57704.1 hypothetical protein CIK06_14515 [Plantactinospora sp. KBS50]
MKNRGLRTLLSVLAGLAVIYLGSDQRDGSHRVSNALLLVAAGAGLIVWQLTKPRADRSAG